MNTLEEKWIDIPEFEGFYKVSNYGRIKSIRGKKSFKEKIRVLKKSNNGYLYTVLSANNKRATVRPHRLVAICFIENLNGYDVVNHLDFNKENNIDSNLEWCTTLQNVQHSCVNGRHYRKPIIQLDMNNNIIREWESAWKVECEKGYFSTLISKCCLGKSKSYKKYKWRFKNE